MGGIRLDWEVESDRVKFEEYEDASLALMRRLRLLRLVAVLAVMIGIIALIIAYGAYRLEQYNGAIEQALRDTVESEVAALRIGDRQIFIDLQRSATDDWFRAQSATYEQYQTLKQTTDIQLTGHIIEVAIDEPRARVHVEEIIAGVPYVRIWYYWLYEDGWHHVPPDYTYWGEPAIRQQANFAIRYSGVDNAFASAFEDKLARWLDASCAALACGQLPFITVDIRPEQGAMRWLDGDNWHLVVPSPYVGGARADMPFNTNLQLEAAALLADRMLTHVMGGMQPLYPADAYFLRSAMASWLVGRFVEISTQSFLIESLVTYYGDAALGGLAQNLTPASQIDILSGIIGVPLSAANLDWRDFLTWRLMVEDDLIARRDEANWLSLYHLRDDAARLTAYSRYSAPLNPEPKQVISVQSQTAADGTPQLLATVQVGEGGATRNELVVFSLVDGVWKRSS